MSWVRDSRGKLSDFFVLTYATGGRPWRAAQYVRASERFRSREPR